MTRLVFHVHDEHPSFGSDTMDFSDLAAARSEALMTCGEMLREAVPDSIWRGQPWRLWATDPDGKTVFALTLHATDE
jgi:hypothetical protein